VLAASRVVVFERSALSMDVADLAAILGPVEPALQGIPRERYGLLIDVRAARGRNDSEFEKRFEPYRQSIQKGFLRVAIVVTTPQGKLQAGRYAREDRLPNTAFDDYAAALRWLEEATLR
jgi:hypothetical protein